MIRKIFSVLLGGAAGCSFLAGFFLFISNVQGSRVPDGCPIESWWLVWGLFLLVPALAGSAASELWPLEQEETEEKPVSRKIYVGRSRHLLRP